MSTMDLFAKLDAGDEAVEGWEGEAPPPSDLADELRAIADGVVELAEGLREIADAVEHAEHWTERMMGGRR